MLFDSALFGWFYGVVLVVTWAARRFATFRLALLLAASVAFYGSWNAKLVLLILFSTLLDYLVAHRIHAAAPGRARRGWLAVSLVGNLGLLGVFKYAGFVRDSIQAVLVAMESDAQLPLVDIVLPVGISFYTFQTLSYTIDVYRGRLEPERSLLRFALFVTFFPQLVAGPIVRAADFLPQLRRPPDDDPGRHGYGVFLILRGLVKKVAIADFLGVTFVDAVFDNPELYSSLEILSAVYAYAVQIYCDFSGYTDIAIGVALTLGYGLPENFRRPYAASSLQDFWRRWHISLSSWLRDYLYVPLGGNRLGPVRTYVNLLVTMLLGGLWHGASWTFVVWGALHGVGLAFGRWWERRNPAVQRGALRRAAGIVFTFHFVCFAWIFFRARTIADAATILRLIGEGSTYVANLGWTVLLATWGLLTIHALPRRWIDGAGRAFAAAPVWAQAAGVVAVLVALSHIGGGGSAFIYFQF